MDRLSSATRHASGTPSSGERWPGEVTWPRSFRAALALLVLTGALASSSIALAAPDAGLTPANVEVPRNTPEEALATFFTLGDRGDFVSAAHVLDVRALDRRTRAEVAISHAEALHAALRARGVAAGDDLERTEDDRRVVDRIGGAGPTLEIAMSHERLADGAEVWVFSRETVSSIPLLERMAVSGPRAWALNALPRSVRHTPFLSVPAWQWLALGASLAAAALAFALLRTITLLITRRTLARAQLSEAERTDHARGLGWRVGALAATATMVASLAGVFADEAGWWVRRLGTSLLILGVGLVAARIVDVVFAHVEAKARAEEGWRARGLRTRLLVFRRILHVLGGIALTAAALVQFEPVRDLGVSLLASAGLAGVVLGFAAQRTLGNLVAGLQLSITQPLRIGDQLTVEGEFGTVEEIALTYVVLRIWDERRLVIPTARLLETPFRNHSRTSTQQIGEVHIRGDFELNIDRFREEAERYVKSHPLFDGRVCAVQVVDADDRAITLRILVSAAAPSPLFDLRCAVREFAVGLMRRMEGEALPRTRFARAFELDGGPREA